MAHSTNYFDTFIAVAPDSKAAAGVAPPPRATPSIAARTFSILDKEPYRFTSDEVVFEVFAARRGLRGKEKTAARKKFFSKGQPCLRCSDLAKKYGWGMHFDEHGRIVLYGVETTEYSSYASGDMVSSEGEPIAIKKAMRSRRG